MGTAVSIRSLQSPGHKLVPAHGLLGTRPHCRRWAMGVRAKLHLYFQSLPTACITAWAQPPVRSALESHRSTSPTVNCTCKGSILHSFRRIILKPTLCFTHSHPLGSMEKLSPMKPILGAKKFGDSWYRHPPPQLSHASERQLCVHVLCWIPKFPRQDWAPIAHWLDDIYWLSSYLAPFPPSSPGVYWDHLQISYVQLNLCLRNHIMADTNWGVSLNYSKCYDVCISHRWQESTVGTWRDDLCCGFPLVWNCCRPEDLVPELHKSTLRSLFGSRLP